MANLTKMVDSGTEPTSSTFAYVLTACANAVDFKMIWMYFSWVETMTKVHNKLCGGIPDPHLPTCNFRSSANRRLNTKVKAIIVCLELPESQSNKYMFFLSPLIIELHFCMILNSYPVVTQSNKMNILLHVI